MPLKTLLSMTFAGALALTTGVANAQTTTRCPAEAANMYTEARRAFEERRFDDSVDLLRSAYDCDPNPTYLANVARTYEEADRPRDALVAWRAYLARVNDEARRPLAEARIAILAKRTAELDRAERERREEAEGARREAEAALRPPPPTVDPPPSPDAPRSGISSGAWAVTSLGAAGVIAGVVLGALAASDHSSAVAEPNVDRAESLQGDAHTLALSANVALVAGGIVTAAGLTWMGIDLLHSSAPTASSAQTGASVRLVALGPTLALTGTFSP